MSAPQNFRNAFNGFNKEDVVQYLEYINNKHTNQVNQLTAELEELRAKAAQPDLSQQLLIESLRETCAELNRKLEESEAAREALEARCGQAETEEPAAEEAPAEAISAELEIYRRAERAEKEARDRAELVYYQANSVLSEATAKVEGVSAEITEMADQILAQLTKMQMMVSSGKQVLQDTAAMLNIIRPNK